MNDVLTVLLLSLLPGAGNFLGAMVAEVRKPSSRFLNWALHAASGVVIAIVTIELMPKPLEVLAGWWIALSFVLGGVAYIALESLVKQLQNKNRQAERNRMWMIYAAVAIDLTSDGIMIGTGAAVSSGLALTLAVGQVLADLPEGYATAANFRDKDVPRLKRLLLSGSFFIYVVGSAMLSYFLLRDVTEQIKMAGLVFVSGLLTVAAVEDMLEEAHEAHEDNHRSILAFVGGFALFTLLSTGLETIIEL